MPGTGKAKSMGSGPGACATTSAETIESSTFRTIREYGQRGEDAKEHGHGGKANTAVQDDPTFMCACLVQRTSRRQLTHPFGDDTAVFKVGGKMFAVLPLVGEPGSVNLKVEPELGRSLVHDYPAITPGYHMNKRHWVTVQLDGTIPEKALRNLIEDSHDLVVAGLPAKVRAA